MALAASLGIGNLLDARGFADVGQRLHEPCIVFTRDLAIIHLALVGIFQPQPELVYLMLDSRSLPTRIPRGQVAFRQAIVGMEPNLHDFGCWVNDAYNSDMRWRLAAPNKLETSPINIPRSNGTLQFYTSYWSWPNRLI
ncbi:hypothetical protein VNO77_14603 [Canavalia gladiata]|uniref:Uncharacterized protein n=1 Tax=Canavalia gladiata TaxID=3824 RepID=A0AAN9QR17_CANGL